MDDKWKNFPPMTEREKRILAETDGHWCYDWDFLAVSAWTYEYDACVCFRKTRLGRLINRFVMWRFNLGWWWTVGRHLDYLRGTEWAQKMIKDIKKPVDKNNGTKVL
jgi:hypothetical protein